MLSTWKLSTEGRQQGTLNKKQYPRLLAKLIAILASENGPENLKSGFKKCGLVPLTLSKFIRDCPLLLPMNLNQLKPSTRSFLKH